MSDQQIPGAGESPDEPAPEQPTSQFGRVDEPEPTLNLGHHLPGPTFPPPGFATAPARPPRARVPGWMWAGVSVLALMLGIAGGALGSYAYDEWDDDGSSVSGRYTDGLSDVDNVSLPPLPDDNSSVAAVAQKMLPSTVQILADFEQSYGQFVLLKPKFEGVNALVWVVPVLAVITGAYLALRESPLPELALQYADY